MPVDNDISGRLALVTGASGGIGSACARDLAAQGVRLALTYSTGKDALTGLIDELRQRYPTLEVSGHQCNVANEADMQRTFDEIKQAHSQHPDILVANAGYGKRVSNILDISLDEWDYTINVNLRSSFILTKLAVPHMLEQGWGRLPRRGSKLNMMLSASRTMHLYYLNRSGGHIYQWLPLQRFKSWCAGHGKEPRE